MANWDVIVVGLGGVGSAAAYHLAARGLRVLGLDQFPPVHDRGSSHGMTRIIRQAYFEHPSYVPMLRRAYELWDGLEQTSHQKLFVRTGLVELGPADGVVIPGVLRSAEEYGLAIEELTVEDVTRKWPGLKGEEDWRAVIESDAGYLRVEDCVESHLALAKNHSAVLRHGRRVEAWRAKRDSVAVRTDQGTEHAASLVLAGGPWSQQLLGEFGVPLRVLRKHQYWYAPQDSGYTEREGFPCFFHETEAGHFYGFPSMGESGLKVCRHDGGTPVEAPTTGHPTDAEDQTLVEDSMRRYLPGVGDDLIRQAGCYYTLTPDEHFVLDVHPEHSQVVIVAGLSGHGFKFTGVLGESAAQLATDGATLLDTSLLSIQRRQAGP